MTFRIAKRHDGRLSVLIGDELESCFPIGMRFDLTLTNGRVVLVPNDDGTSQIVECCAYATAGYTRSIGFMSHDDLPSFTIDDCDFDLVGDDVLVYELPEVHNLAWTQSPPRNDTLCDVIRHNLRARLASAASAGVSYRVVIDQVPVWARSQLLGGEFASIVKEYFA